MKLYIRNMVSASCKAVVKSELKKLRIDCSEIKLGEVEIDGTICETQYSKLKEALKKYELELITDKKSVLIEKVKNSIVELIYFSDISSIKTNFSNYLSEKLNYNYTFISNQFSEAQGTSIRSYVILHKIERIKELLAYNEFTISEIAYKLNYSSVGHLCNQFKKVTGLTPSNYKEAKHHQRTELGKI
jgi:YesN/AraC family two-component response regulator